jgi:hypothetical protein
MSVARVDALLRLVAKLALVPATELDECRLLHDEVHRLLEMLFQSWVADGG